MNALLQTLELHNYTLSKYFKVSGSNLPEEIDLLIERYKIKGKITSNRLQNLSFFSKDKLI
jgi:hypothetical protein